jgi:sterol desaturase/sphingolipid hydroxylase (fatty acid hydroxylase superfamily)
LYFNYNYGQFTTLWDRLGGSYRKPNEELFRRETKIGAVGDVLAVMNEDGPEVDEAEKEDVGDLLQGEDDDGEYVANSPIVNGAACHTMHHLYFNYNYGQFTTRHE